MWIREDLKDAIKQIFSLYTKPKKILIIPDIFMQLHEKISYLSKTTKLV